jgi:tetratricopeptide (TPR) repeat protein
MRRVFVAIAVCLLVAHRVDAADWNSLRTEHFLLLGDASPRAIKDVALRFEQFRSAVTSAFVVLADDRPGPPVIVIVFRDQRAYEPYQPRFNGKAVRVGGYFLGGRDVNYITVTAETGGDDFRAVYHEYTHLLMQRLAGNFSLWLHEGLAEYFSTFEADGRTARFGRPIGSHVDLLRERQMQLSELFAVTHDSTTYNEGNRRSLFYAQSWLLVHYAFIENPDRWKQLIQFDTLVNRGIATDDAFQQAFNAPQSVLEKELFDYARRPAMHYQAFELDQRLVTRLQAEPVRLPEAEAQARLGDLLTHAGRNDEAAALLTNVLKTAPDLPLAHAALGALLLRQDNGDEAMAHLERAAAGRDTDEFVQFYYGSALIERAARRNGGDADLRKGIAALEQAVKLRPGFADAERMLGYAYLETGDAAKAQEALRRVLDAALGDEDVVLLLAEAYLRLGRLNDARGLLGPLVGRAKEPSNKERARDLLARSAGIERQQQVRNEVAAEPATPAGAAPAAETPATPLADSRPSNFHPALRDVQAGETRTYGLLTEIECVEQQIVLHVRAPGETLLLRAARFDAVDFISYRSTTPGRISCGARRPAEDVYVTWRRGEASVPSGTSQGTAVAVELLPDGYVPTK